MTKAQELIERRLKQTSLNEAKEYLVVTLKDGTDLSSARKLADKIGKLPDVLAVVVKR